MEWFPSELGVIHYKSTVKVNEWMYVLDMIAIGKNIKPLNIAFFIAQKPWKVGNRFWGDKNNTQIGKMRIKNSTIIFYTNIFGKINYKYLWGFKNYYFKFF